jgi:Replication-relaxation
MSQEPRPVRVRQAHVEWVRARLGEREQAIIQTVEQLRLVSAVQLERLHFAELSEGSRARTRRRVLARLIDWRVLTPLERRIGGVRAGSSGLIVALDTCGHLRASELREQQTSTVRRPYQPGLALVGHVLKVSELYVSLVELSRTRSFELDFDTEPRCWWPNGLGGWLRPDAFLRLSTDSYSDAWWLELDMSTEHLPTLGRKLTTYLDFAEHGVGPNGVMPRVLVNVPDQRRADAVASLIQRMPDPATKLVHVTTHAYSAHYLLEVLHE